jgi:hypothetical protein
MQRLTDVLLVGIAAPVMPSRYQYMILTAFYLGPGALKTVMHTLSWKAIGGEKNFPYLYVFLNRENCLFPSHLGLRVDAACLATGTHLFAKS